MPENNTVNPRIESLLDIRRFEPNLQINDPQYTRTLNDYLRQLQNNIEDILKVPFLQGRQGDSVLIGEFPLFDEEADCVTEVGQELIKALFPLVPESEWYWNSISGWQDIIDNISEYAPVHDVHAWENLCPNNEYNLQVQLYYINNYNDPTERIPLGSATYFVYYDPRLVEISGGHDSTFVFEDVSAAIFRESYEEGTETLWRFVNSGILPTIYWSAETGYWCWSINNIHTGIRCEGVRGQDGLDGNARVVRVSTDSTSVNSDDFSGMKICTINSVFDTALNGWVNYGEEGFDSLLEEDMIVFAIIDDVLPSEPQPVHYNPNLSFGVVFKDANNNIWKCYAYTNTSLETLAQAVSLESLLNQINSSNNTPIKGLFVKDYGSASHVVSNQRLYHCLYSNAPNTFRLSPMKIYSNGVNIRFDVDIERDKKLEIDYNVQINNPSDSSKFFSFGYDDSFFSGFTGISQQNFNLISPNIWFLPGITGGNINATPFIKIENDKITIQRKSILYIKLETNEITVGNNLKSTLIYNDTYGYVKGTFGTKKDNNVHEKCTTHFRAYWQDGQKLFSELYLCDALVNNSGSYIKIYAGNLTEMGIANLYMPNDKSGYLIYDGNYYDNSKELGVFNLLANSVIPNNSDLYQHSSIIFREPGTFSNTDDWWTNKYHFAYGRDKFKTMSFLTKYFDYFSVNVDKLCLRAGDNVIGNVGESGIIYPGYTEEATLLDNSEWVVGHYTREEEVEQHLMRTTFTGMSLRDNSVSVGRTITDTQQIRTRSSDEETVTTRTSCVLNFTENGLQIGSYDEDDNFNGISIENATKSITIGSSDDPIFEINDGEVRINNANYSNTIEYTNYGKLYSMNMFRPNNKVDTNNPSLYNLFEENVCLCDNIHNDNYDGHIYDMPITNIIPQTVNIPLKFIPSMNPIDAFGDPYPINYTILNTLERQVIDIVPRHNYLIISIDTLASEIASFNDGLDNINIHFSISFWDNGHIINNPMAPQGIQEAFNLEINQYLSNKNVLILNPCEKIMALGPEYDSVKVFDSYRVIMRLEGEAITKTISLHIEQINIEKSSIKENVLSCYNVVFNANEQ